MTESEKKAFYIATCRICLLAQNMKDCQACQFKIGLVEKTPGAFFFIPVESQKTSQEVYALATA